MAATKRKTPRERELRLVASHGVRTRVDADVRPREVEPTLQRDSRSDLRGRPAQDERELGEAAQADRARDSERIDSFDVQDVPAAVLCARCGMSDCSGSCEDVTASGVFVLVPWERGDGSFFRRLFATARATTVDADPFFERLADGPVWPALTFAIAAELFAALAVTVLVAVPAALLFPEFVEACLFDPSTRRAALGGFLVGVPGLAALLVVAHAAHGLSVDVGAQRNGARGSRTRALRFGLYATGWDLVVGPLGAIVLAFSDGPRAAMGMLARAAGLPTRATRAFLKNAYRLEGEGAARALRVSYWGAGLATVFAAATIVGAVVFALVRSPG